MASKVSFTIRRPTPVSRAASSGPDSDAGSSFKVPQLPPHLSRNGDPTPLGSPLARSETSSPHPRHSVPEGHDHHSNDSSDEGSVVEDELVTGFDRFGVQRLNGRKKVEKPLVIPALKNKDWRELARKRRSAAQYVPPSGAARTGKDGSVGGLGTKDSINSGPVLSGLQVKPKKTVDVAEELAIQETEDVKMEVAEEETEDQRALRAILAESNGEHHHEGPMIDIIQAPISETDALKQDVDELPDAATLADYTRVPVSQFGAAMLRGMGWKEGTAATRKPGKGLVEPYLPAARPALLGIGAKEQEVLDDGSNKSNKSKRPERRYVPIIKQERSNTASPVDGGSTRRDRSRSPRRSATSSRRNSPNRYNSRDDGNGDSSKRRYDDDRYRDADKRPRGEDRDWRRDDDRHNERRDQNQERRRDEDRSGRRDDGRDRSERTRERSYDSRRKRD